MKKFAISLMIVLIHLVKVCKELCENTGAFMGDTLMWHGKPGAISYNVPLNEADGLIRYRHRDPSGFRVEEITFRVFNRWPMNGKRRPSGRFMFMLHTDALTAGYPVQSIIWLKKGWLRLEDSALNISLLDKAPYATENTRRLKALHDFLSTYFPAIKRDELTDFQKASQALRKIQASSFEGLDAPTTR